MRARRVLAVRAFACVFFLFPFYGRVRNQFAKCDAIYMRPTERSGWVGRLTSLARRRPLLRWLTANENPALAVCVCFYVTSVVLCSITSSASCLILYWRAYRCYCMEGETLPARKLNSLLRCSTTVLHKADCMRTEHFQTLNEHRQRTHPINVSRMFADRVLCANARRIFANDICLRSRRRRRRRQISSHEAQLYPNFS